MPAKVDLVLNLYRGDQFVWCCSRSGPTAAADDTALDACAA